MIRLQLLGSASLLLADGSVVALGSQDALLLARLRIEGPQARKSMAAWLWPDGSGERQMGNLRQRLHRLQKAVARNLVEGDRELRLACGVTSDLDGIERQIVEETSSAYSPLLATMNRWSSEPAMDWLDQARAALTARLTDIVVERARVLEEAGDIAAALKIALRALSLQPTDEVHHVRVIRYLYRLDHRAEAIAAYNACVDMCAREWRSKPSKATRSLGALLQSTQTAVSPMSSSVRDPSVQAALARPTRLSGRDGLMQRLHAELDESPAVILLGEPGIGKSRIVEEWIDEQPTSRLLLRALPGDGLQPYAVALRLVSDIAHRANGDAPRSFKVMLRGLPLSEGERHVLARLATGTARPSGHTLERGEIARASTHLLLNATRSTRLLHGLRGIAVDDIHFADVASIDLISEWIRSPLLTDLRWVLAARSAELPTQLLSWIDMDALEVGLPGSASAMRQFGIEDPTNRRIRPIKVGPLDEQGIDDLMRTLHEAVGWGNLGVTAAELCRHAGGHPLLTLQCLHEVGHQPTGQTGRRPEWSAAQVPLPTPQRAVTLLRPRIVALEGAARELVQLAALAGQDFSAERASKLMGRPVLEISRAWQALQDLGLFTGEGFGHDLIRTAALSTISRPMQRLLCASLAEMLSSDPAVPPGRVAPLWKAAERWAEAATAFAAAAHFARTLSGWNEEAAALRLALECQELASANGSDAPAPDRNRFQLQLRLVEAMRYTTTFEQRVSACEELVAAADGATETVEALCLLALTQSDNSHFEQSLVPAGEADRLVVRHALGAGLQLKTTSLLAMAFATLGMKEDALACVDRFRRLLATPHDIGIDARLPALFSVSQALIQLEEEALAEDLVLEAKALLDDQSHGASECEVWMKLAWIHYKQGRLFESIECSERVAAISQLEGAEYSWMLSGAQIGMQRARAYRDAGRYRESEQLLATLIADSSRSDMATVTPALTWEMAHLLCRLGQREQATVQLRAPVEGSLPSLMAGWLAARARVCATSDAQALELLGEALELVSGRAPKYYSVTLRAYRAQFLPPDLAVDSLLDSLRLAEHFHVEIWKHPLQAWLCAALFKVGDVQQALPLARSVVHRIERGVPSLTYLPEAWWYCGQILQAAGDEEAATKCLASGRKWLADTIESHVPPRYQHSFIGSSPVHSALLQAGQ